MPAVSVLVPNYNHARFLGQRLTSIFNQTYEDFELIFLDDASSDDSVDVFRRYSNHNNVRAILNDRNSGSAFRQWNKGIQAANGRYIWIAESDDAAEPHFLETLVPILESNPQVGIAYCNSTITDENGEKQYTVDRWAQNVDAERWLHDYMNPGSEECRRFLICRNSIPNASAVVFRKSVYELCGHANDRMTRCGDWWLWVQMLFFSDVAYVAAPLNLFRRHTSLSNEISNFWSALEEALQIQFEIVRRLGLCPEVETVLSRTFVDNLRLRQSWCSTDDLVALPPSILHLAALISERLYLAILEYVHDHTNWKIDWSPTPSCSVEKCNIEKSGSNDVFKNLSAIIVKQHQQLIALNSKLDNLLSSRPYRLAQRLRNVRNRIAPQGSVRHRCLRMMYGWIKRVRTGRAVAPGM